MAPRLHLKIALTDEVLLGPGKAQLLSLVAETGSISAAARAMSMSYRRAWMLIDELNRTFKSPVVTTAKGGRGGGGSAVLTPVGALIIKRYAAIMAKTEKAIAADIKALSRELK
jgi:molybdate transport system regulatory protein